MPTVLSFLHYLDMTEIIHLVVEPMQAVQFVFPVAFPL